MSLTHIVNYSVKLSITKLASGFTFTHLFLFLSASVVNVPFLSLSLFLNFFSSPFFSNFLQFFISTQIFLFLYLFLLLVAVAFSSLGSSSTYNFAIGVKKSSSRLGSELGIQYQTEHEFKDCNFLNLYHCFELFFLFYKSISILPRTFFFFVFWDLDIRNLLFSHTYTWPCNFD
jgi:hypothetical protein